jgi:hypothetical protein
VIARGIRLLMKLALVAAALWAVRWAFTRWIDGPAVGPSSAAWPPAGGEPERPPAPSEVAVSEVAVTEMAVIEVAASGVAAGTADAGGESGAIAAPKASKARKAPAVAPATRAPAKKAAAGAAKKTTTPGKIVSSKESAAARKAVPSASETATPAKRTTSARIVGKKKAPPAPQPPWVPPGPDGCPSTHQVKAKLSSMIYHLPGMAFYARTVPDRCYASADEAEADGFARAKR